MRETRLKIAKTLYERGNISHPYVVEFWDELTAPPKEVEKPKIKKKRRKR